MASIADCDSGADERVLAGCTALIKGATLDAASLSLAHSRRADALIRNGRIDEAITDLTKALQIQPGDVGHKGRLSHAHLLRAAMLRESKAFGRALADIDQALTIDPTNDKARFDRGVTLAAQGDLRTAIEEVKAAVERNSGNHLYGQLLLQLYETSAQDHLAKGNWKSAVSDYSEAIRLSPANADLLVGRANAYAGDHQTDKVIGDYNEAIRLKPGSPEPYVRRGELLYRSGDLTNSLADLNTAIRLNPTSSTAHILKGLIHEAAGMSSLAAEDYRTVLHNDPSHQLARSSLARVAPGIALPAPQRKPAATEGTTTSPTGQQQKIPKQSSATTAAEKVKHHKCWTYSDCAAKCEKIYRYRDPADIAKCVNWHPCSKYPAAC